tara:strand:- start:131 stop:661 length:531 start_codon:yes stop_codon:yes gene_type:complete
LKKIFLIFTFLLIFPNLSKSANIYVINIEELINTNNFYKKILKEIDISQNNYSKNFQIEELKIEKLSKEIEKNKLILNENEINILINQYNDELNKLNILVDKFNLHYQNQIINIRKLILEEIIVLVEKYAKDNNIDLILDSNNYLIASNKINITMEIKSMLKKINLKLEFEHFETD